MNDIKSLATWMGAMQAQDYTHVKWAFGLRRPDITDADLEEAFVRGDIIRTHLLRPTWHIVAAADARWMLALSAPQILPVLTPFNQQLGLDATIYRKCNDLLEQSLQGNQHFTRDELVQLFAQAGIMTNGMGIAHILMQAELHGIICNGHRRGKQQTYALLEERLPPAPMLVRQDAIVALAERYFKSHAPATLQDFQWWSGLKVADAKAGLEAIKDDLVPEKIDNQTYWLPKGFQPDPPDDLQVHLLPAFDEFLISYKDRSASLAPAEKGQVITVNGIFKPAIIVNGWVRGFWQRDLKKDKITLNHTFFSPMNDTEQAVLDSAAARYIRFVKNEK